MMRNQLFFFLVSSVVLFCFLTTPKTVFACSGAFSKSTTTCAPASCSGNTVSGTWEAYVKYSNNRDYIGTCTQLEYFPDGDCDVLGPRASNPCSASCNYDSECGAAGVCASGNPSPADVCSGNRGSKPWWCQGYNCGYNCTSSYECKQVPVGQGGYGPLSTCEQYCVDHPTPPPEEPVTPPPPPGTTITPTSPPSLQCNQAYGTCGCVPGTGCQDGSQTDYRCCYRTCDLVKQQCVTMFGQGRANTCDSTDPNIPDPKCITAANFNGLCKISGNQATFNVIGGRCPASNPKCSRADYTSGAHAGEAAWEAEAVPFSHSVFPNERFTWYVNGKSSSAICKISTKTQCGQEGCIVDEDCDSTYQCEDQCN